MEVYVAETTDYTHEGLPFFINGNWNSSSNGTVDAWVGPITERYAFAKGDLVYKICEVDADYILVLAVTLTENGLAGRLFATDLPGQFNIVHRRHPFKPAGISSPAEVLRRLRTAMLCRRTELRRDLRAKACDCIRRVMYMRQCELAFSTVRPPNEFGTSSGIF